MFTILLCLLRAAGVFALLALFCPFCYRVSADTNNNLTLRVNWLFGTVGALVAREGEAAPRVFFTLCNLKFAVKQREGKAAREKKPKKREPAKRAKKKPKAKKAKSGEKVSFWSRVKLAATDISRVTNYPHKALLIKKVKLCLKRLFKRLKPKELFIGGEAGFSYPHVTGLFVAAESVVVSVFKIPVNIKGRFNGKSCFLRFRAKGRIRFASVLWPVLALLLKNPVRGVLTAFLFGRKEK